jgi:hypothetical protein
MSRLGHRKGVASSGVSWVKTRFINRQTSNGAQEFQSSSIIMCQQSVGVVDYVGRSVLLKVKLAECTKRNPRTLLASDENRKCL